MPSWRARRRSGLVISSIPGKRGALELGTPERRIPVNNPSLVYWWIRDNRRLWGIRRSSFVHVYAEEDAVVNWCNPKWDW
jgi:hypothetical protein